VQFTELAAAETGTELLLQGVMIKLVHSITSSFLTYVAVVRRTATECSVVAAASVVCVGSALMTRVRSGDSATAASSLTVRPAPVNPLMVSVGAIVARVYTEKWVTPTEHMPPEHEVPFTGILQVYVLSLKGQGLE
jgi:hypothetical protein